MEREQLRPTFSVIHPTRGRREQAMRARLDYVTKAVRPRGLEYLLVVDACDLDLPWFQKLDEEAELWDVIVVRPEGCAAAFNEGARHATGQVLVCAADDVVPPDRWDERLLEVLGDARKERVVATSDGHRSDRLIAHPILTRKRFERQGRTVFDPAFSLGREMYSDADFTERAYADGVVIEARELVFEHRHPSFGLASWDDTYRRSNDPESYRAGRALFEKRWPRSTIR